MRTETVYTATENHLFQTVLIMASRLPHGAKLNQHQVCCKAAGPGVFIFRIAKHRGSGKGCVMKIAEEGTILKQSNKITYILYNWQGKCKWVYLEGVFLVDPNFEAEFKHAHEVA